MSTQPTAGAVRAANALMDMTHLRATPINELAEVIDRETGAKELADALAGIIRAGWGDKQTITEPHWIRKGRQALARYNGGTS